MRLLFVLILLLAGIQDGRHRSVSVLVLAALLATALVLVPPAIRLQRIALAVILTAPVMPAVTRGQAGGADPIVIAAVGLRACVSTTAWIVASAALVGLASTVCTRGVRGSRRDVPFVPCIAAAWVLHHGYGG